MNAAHGSLNRRRGYDIKAEYVGLSSESLTLGEHASGVRRELSTCSQRHWDPLPTSLTLSHTHTYTHTHTHTCSYSAEDKRVCCGIMLSDHSVSSHTHTYTHTYTHTHTLTAYGPRKPSRAPQRAIKA